MKLVISILAALALSACSSSESAFVGSPHGYTGSVSTIWADVSAAPSILQPGESALQSNYGADGSQADMPSTYSVDVAGNLSATGVAATWLAKSRFCMVAPVALACGGPAVQ